MDFEGRLEQLRSEVNDRLDQLLPPASTEPAMLHQAMRHSCLAPGKRLRPIFAMACSEAICGNHKSALNVACAVEMIHCFSMIHDDLPSIDNDDLRRGRPTCHKAYGDGIAILAGDALFALAFQVIANAFEGGDQTRFALQELAIATGSSGLVGGEVLDILSERTVPTLAVLQNIHERKTGALIAASCVLGGISAKATNGQIELLREYGKATGLAFQVIDDVLNETSTSEHLGKSVGTDREYGKMTYPALMGIEASKEVAFQSVKKAFEILDKLQGNKGFLIELANYSIERTH